MKDFLSGPLWEAFCCMFGIMVEKIGVFPCHGVLPNILAFLFRYFFEGLDFAEVVCLLMDEAVSLESVSLESVSSFS